MIDNQLFIWLLKENGVEDTLSEIKFGKLQIIITFAAS